MWKCPQCGRQNSGEIAVCSGCGAAAGAQTDVRSLTGELLRLLASGKKLEAVKYYKDHTGASLVNSKNAVETLERGGSLPGMDGQDSEAEFTSELRSLLQQGRKLQAVKLYKDRTGVSLMDAKNAVEAIEGIGGAASVAVDDAVAQELLPLLRMGELREAVRLYKRRTGARSKEAKRAVLALARQHGAYDRESAWLRTAILLGLLLIAALAAIAVVVLLGE
jgi:ribosomal protein L7/L12